MPAGVGWLLDPPGIGMPRLPDFHSRCRPVRDCYSSQNTLILKAAQKALDLLLVNSLIDSGWLRLFCLSGKDYALTIF